MNKQDQVFTIRAKVSAAGKVDIAGIKGDLKFHVFNLEESDEELGLLTLYCFNEPKFTLLSQVTQKDVPPVLLDSGELDSSLFQTLNPDLFAGLAKINKIKELNSHAHLSQVNAQTAAIQGTASFYELELIFCLNETNHEQIM